ncbi:hypothetical protein QA640_19185 [Bradyrhizobium sp. CB82]|uniref:hypothetical protein n=1 Tax=Bradyrhizobium sp. CB82 TaxID=3039159 RepID=UPI0024B2551D|nr:hypothetical protein [Bradyrhizobium sp. CB82]WFU44379.1 hypothetical protein QA640_19185 [Bradyrhizobium sp. CB82]
MAKGIVGFVTDVGVRDGLAIRKRGSNVFCYGLLKGTVKETHGDVQIVSLPFKVIAK